jgi:hypothetical protein
MTNQYAVTAYKAFFASLSVSSPIFVDRNLSSPIGTSGRGPGRKRGVAWFAAALMLLCAFCVCGHAQTLVPNWIQQLPANTPSARYDGALAYDSAHSQVVMFGGLGSPGTLGETWLWNGTTWSQASPATVPAARANQAMAYDALHGQVVMFGGINSLSTRTNDTWLWDGTNWTQASPANSPPARDGATMVFDAALGQVVLFGGVNTTGTVLSDTWLWNGTNWSQASPATSPAGRFDHAMAYDAAHSQVVLFGGFNGSYLNDTWLWDGTNWTQQAPATNPGVRNGQGMDYDAALGQVVLFGGYNGSVYLNDTWTWNGTNWAQQSPTTSPSQSYATNAIVYDAAEGGLVLFEGYGGDTAFSTTWVWGNPQNFGSVNVCPTGQLTPAPCSEILSLTYTVTSTTNFGPPQIVTQGTAGLDFQFPSSGTNNNTCTGTVSAGDTCTINVNFVPQAPGLRAGAIELINNVGEVLTTTPVYGVGEGPEIAYGPGSPAAVSLGGSYSLSSPVTVDAAGNIYFAASGQAYKKTTSGVQTLPSAGEFYAAQSIAVDGAGDVFVADNEQGKVFKLPASGGTQTTVYPSQPPSGPTGVAVDGQGDIFVADSELNEVIEIPANGGSNTVVYGPPSSGASVDAVAVDGDGDLFIALAFPGKVLEIPAGCSNTSCQVAVGTGWNAPASLALDAAGNVYVADPGLASGNGEVVQVTPGCSSSACQYVLANGSTIAGGVNAFSVAVDGQGDVYYINIGTNENGVGSGVAQLYEISRSQAPSLSFDTTNVGSVSADSPQSFTALNVGNQTLSAILPGFAATGPNFYQVSGTGTPADCLYNFSLAPGVACNVSISFEPQVSGSIAGTATFTDNNLNGNPATQAIYLSGNATAVSGVPLAVSGQGSGTVVSTPPGINCTIVAGIGSGTCTANFPDDSLVSLQETPSAEYAFQAWSGCAGSDVAPTCSFTITGGTAATASFTPGSTPYTLSVTASGSGTAIVTDNSAAINCQVPFQTGSTCSASFASGTSVTLTATPSAGTLFIGWGGACASAGTSPTCQLTMTSAMNAIPEFTQQNVGNVNVCASGQSTPAPCNVSIPVLFNPAAPITVSSVRVVTQGTTGLDFSQGTVGTCSGTVSPGNGCNVNVNFAPTAPGLRMGAVQLLDGSGNVLATQSIYGIGQGPAIAFSPGTQTVLPVTGLNKPTKLALDGAGNLFIADYASNQVVEVTPGGVQTTVPTSGLNSPTGVAVDGAGNLFIVNNGSATVVEVPAGCTTAACQVTVPVSGLGNPYDVAVDGAGDLFIADASIPGVVKLTPSGVQSMVPATGLSGPFGVAVDAAGDVFIADTYGNQVVEVTAGGVQTTVPAVGVTSPEGVWADVAGDVFIADSIPNNRIVEVPAGGGAQTLVYTGSAPEGVVTDGVGDIFIADTFNSQVVEISGSQPTVNLGIVSQNYQSTDTSITIENVGNQTLTGAMGAVLGQYFFEDTANSTCTTISLNPGASCIENFYALSPVVGPISANAVVTDNSLNGNPATQTATLSALSVGPTVTVSATGSGTGSGVVEENPTGINCGFVAGAGSGTCSSSASTGLTVSFEEFPTAGSTFTGWGGACASYGTNQFCTVFVTAATNVTVSFATASPTNYALQVTEVGTGSGTVSSNSGGIACSLAGGVNSGTCSSNITSGSQVVLTAIASGNSVFTGWGGDCASSGASLICTVTMNSALNASASFVAPGASQAGILKPITAGVVYGQGGSFTTNAPNDGGTVANGYSFLSNVAVDASGNLYVADGGNNRVLYYPRGSTNPTRVYGQNGSFTNNSPNGGGAVSASGLSNPVGLSLDGGGNLYVADMDNNRVLFYPAGQTTPTKVYGQPDFATGTPNTGGVSANSMDDPWGIAVDAGGDLYVSDYVNSRVLYFPAGSTTATRVYGQSGSFSSSAVNSGGVSANSLNQPTGVALDPSGDLYVTDIYNNRVLFYPYGSTTATQVYGQGGSFTSNAVNNGGLNAGSLNSPVALTVDSSGDLYVVDRDNNRMLFFPFGSTTATRVYGQLNSFTSSAANNGGVSANSFSEPWAVALDPSGNLYVSDYSNNRVLEFGSFGNVNVCPSSVATPAPCNSTITMSYYAAATTNFGATQVVTQGVSGLDFSLTGGGTCIGAVTAGNACTVNVNFAPLAPGSRLGAVELFDIHANPLTTAPISGIGQAPEIAFGPGTQTTISTGSYTLNQAKGLAVDAAGDLFIADTLNQRVLKVAANGTQTTVGFGLLYPQSVAVDGAGDVFIADNNLGEVLEVPAGCTNSTCQIVLVSQQTSSYQSELGVAVDAVGNVFFSDYLDGKVVKIPANGGAMTVVYNPTGSNPVDLGTDAAGDLFIGDFGLQTVAEVPAGCSSSSCWKTIGTGWQQPDSVSVDAAGDVFVADHGLSEVVEVPAGCTSSACQIVLASGINTVAATVDTLANVFISNQATNQVVEINQALPPSFNLALTNVGSTSIDSPQSVSVQNVGNQPLTGSLAFSLGTNFVPNPASTCGSGFTLAPGSSCSESFSFTPQTTGYLTGSAGFSDNTFNLSPLVVLQTVNLSGNGGLNGQAVGVLVPNVVGLAQAAAAAPITGAGLAVGTVSTASSSIVPSGSVIASNPAAGTQVNVGSQVRLLVSSGQAAPPMPNPLSLENNYFVTGDYASAGVTLRGHGIGGVATGTITIPSSTANPGVSQGVPDGADIIDGFLYWETLENTPSPSGGNGTFLGYSITGQQIGSDLANYTDGAFTGTLRVYRADVNTYFQGGTNGVRYASGSFTVTLPDSGGTGFPLTEGASLVVIYRVLSPNFPLKSVIIYDGSAAPTGSTTQNVQGFYDSVGGGESTTVFAAGGSWNNSSGAVTVPAQSSQYSAPLNAGSAYAAVILSTPVLNSDNDGILDSWKTGPTTGDFYSGQPGYYDVKSGSWVPLPGAKHGEKDLFVQMDYMCGAVLSNGSCDPNQENLFPSPDASGNDPLAMVTNAFAADGVVLHLEVGNAVPEDSCTDNVSTPGQLCQFPSTQALPQPGVIGWKNSLEFSKLWPKNLASCAAGGDCSPRFPYGQKDSYHYVLFGHSLAVPAWNSRYGTLTSINVVNGVTTIGTADRGTGTSECPSRITISGVLGSPSLNGVYNTTSCPDSKTIVAATPGVPNWSYPNNTLPEPVIGITSGTVTSISGYSDLGGSDSAVTLGLWETAPNQDMSKRANVIAGTLFHEIGHTLGLSHGGLYYQTPGSYVPNFDVNCKPNYQSVMNYLFQLDGVGPSAVVAYSSQTLETLNETSLASVANLTDGHGNPATYSTSAWYTPNAPSPTTSAATMHCDGTPLTGDTGYRVNGSVAPVSPSWASGQNITFDGVPYTQMLGYNDVANLDLRQVGATGGEFASLASVLTFGSSTAPLNVAAGGTVALGSGGTVALGSGGTVTLGSGGNVTLGSGGTIALGSGGTVTLGSGGNVTIPAAGGTVTPGSNGLVTLGSGGNVTLGSGGTITLGSGGNVTLGSGGTIALGSGGTITSSVGTVTIPSSGGSYTLPTGGGTIALGSGGTIALGSGGNVTLGSGGTIALGSGGNVTLGSGGNVTLGSGGTIALGSGGTIALGSGGNVTLGSGGIVTLGSGGNVTLGSGGNVTLGSGGTVTLGSGGNVTLGSGGNVTLGSGGTIALGSGGTVTLGSGGNVTLGSGGTISLGSGGTETVGPGTYTIPSGGGTITMGSGGTIALGSGGNVTLGSGGTITMGSGGTVTLGSGGNVTLGSGGVVALGSGGNVTLGSGGNIALGSGGNVTLGSGGASTAELTYETANSVVRPPSSPTETPTLAGTAVVVNWTAPAFGVVSTYTISRSSDGATPIVIGSVSGINGNPPATTFTDTNPDLTSQTVVYTISTTLLPVAIDPTQRQSGPSTPAVLTNSQTIVLGSLPSSVSISSSTLTVTATAESNSAANGLQVSFSTTGSCTVGNQSINTASGVSSATLTLNSTGGCTITASQAGSNLSQPGNPPYYNAANPVSGTVMVLPQGSNTQSQTILFAQLPNVQYGSTFSLSASSSSGLAVSFKASGPCTTSGGITGVGQCTITASAPANSTYSAASVVQSFAVYPAVLKVTATSVSVPYGQPLPSLTSTYSGFVNNESASVVSGAPALTTTATSGSNPGNYPITVSTGTLAAANYSFLYVSGTLTIQSTTQSALTLITTSPLTYNQSETLSVTGGSSGGAVTYNLTGGLCTLVGAQLTASSGTGSCTVTATMAGNSSYSAVTSSPASVTLAMANQTITFTQPISPVNYGVSPITLTATGGASGNVVMFKIDPASTATGSITGNTLTVTGVGNLVIDATQAGNTNYNAATQVQRTVVVNAATATISINDIPSSAVYGGSFTPTYLYSGSGSPAESTVSTTTAVCTVSSGVVRFVDAGPCTLTANAAATTDYSAVTGSPQTFTVGAATATISINDIPSSAVYGGSFTPTYLYSGNGSPAESTVSTTTAVCTVSAGVVKFVGAGPCTLTASAAATTDYSAVTGSPQTFTVRAATATISINDIPSTAVYGGSFTPTYLYSGTGSPAESTLSTTTAVCTVSAGVVKFVGVGPCTLTASAAATTDYSAVTGSTQTFTVGQATQTITFTQPSSPVTYGVAPISLTATGGASGIAVAFTIDASSTGKGTITGNALTITGAGTLVIDATQAGNTDYKPATLVQRTIAVNKAVLTVTANNASRAYGLANPTFTAGYAGYVNGDTFAKAVTGSPSLTTTAVATSLPGTYAIVASQGSLAAANYSFNFVNGTLTITYTGSVPASGTSCNGAYSGTFQGNLTVTNGQTCMFVSGGASGNITETGGNLVLSGGSVGGNVTVTGGTFSIGPSTTIKSNLVVQSIPKSSATNQVCGTTISGSLQFQSNGTAVLIGSGTSSCAGNVIKGSLQVTSNSAAITIDANTISNSLQVQSNTGATTMDGNTVGGSLQDQSNTGPTQLVSNNIAGVLQCQSNTTITGSGNTAASKTGQCAKF